MTLYLTIRPLSNKIVGATGTADSAFNNDGTAFSETNSVFQTSTGVVGLAAELNPALAPVLFSTAWASTGTAIGTLLNDITAGRAGGWTVAQEIAVLGDAITIAGDITTSVGAFAVMAGIPGLGTAAEVLGLGLTYAGLVINPSETLAGAITNFSNDPLKTISSLVSSTMTGIQSLENTISTWANGQSSVVGSDWASIKSSFLQGDNAVNSVINDVSNGNSTALNTDSNTAYNAFNPVQGGFANIATADNIILPTINETWNGYAVSVTSSTTSLPTINSNLSYNSSNGAISVNDTTSNAPVNQAETVDFANNNIIETTNGYPSSGGTQYTQTVTTTSTGSVTASITGTGDSTYLSNANITLSNGASATINGNSDVCTIGSGANGTIIGNNDTTTLNQGAGGATIQGNNGQVSDGFGTGFSLTGTGDQVNIGSYTFAQTAASFNAATNALLDQLSNGNTVSISNGSQATLTGGDGTAILTNNVNGKIDDLINWNNPGAVATGSSSRDYQFSGFGTGINYGFTDYSGSNASGTKIDDAVFGNNNGLQTDFYSGQGTGVSQTSFDFTAWNTNNTYLSQATTQNTDGTSQTEFFNIANNSNNTGWNSITDYFNQNGQIIQSNQNYGWGYDVTQYNNNGDATSTNDYYNNGQQYGYSSGGGTQDGGGDDFVNSGTLAGINIGLAQQNGIAQSSNVNATLAAQNALAQANAVVTSQQKTGFKSVLDGGKWSGTITWSIANSVGTAANPFSSFIGTAYQGVVQQAINAWASNSGLQFQQVTDSTNADIRIGFGNFNTATSGILGYTAYQTNGNSFLANEIVRVEDPNQLALANNANGMLTYSGTNATLYQALLHEIGQYKKLSMGMQLVILRCKKYKL